MLLLGGLTHQFNKTYYAIVSLSMRYGPFESSHSEDKHPCGNLQINFIVFSQFVYCIHVNWTLLYLENALSFLSYVTLPRTCTFCAQENLPSSACEFNTLSGLEQDGPTEEEF